MCCVAGALGEVRALAASPIIDICTTMLSKNSDDWEAAFWRSMVLSCIILCALAGHHSRALLEP